MNQENHALLDMMLRPAFFVREGTIAACNAAARSLLLEEGMALDGLLLTGAEELEAFTGGCLYLQLDLSGTHRGASATCMDGGLLMVLDQEEGELRALSLAARELRDPVNSLLAISDSLLPAALPNADPKVDGLLARMSKGLYQLQRILGNMADGAQGTSLSQPEVRNLARVFEDIFQKASALLSLAGIRLCYQGLPLDVYGFIDMDQMERAILNVLSNAAKFLPPEGQIQAALTRQGSCLRLTIQDNGPGIGEDLLGSLFARYLRQPGIEDSRHGLGLGMVMIRNAAASHGGTVLVDCPKEGGTRVMITMKIRQDSAARVRSPLQGFTGGRDQALIELSQILPLSVYEKER